MARDARVVEEDARARIAAQDVVSLLERELARAPVEPVSERRARSPFRSRGLDLRRSRKGVSEAVHGPDQTLLVLVTDRGADLRQKARQRSVGNEGVGPELLVDLRLRKSARPVLDQDLQQVERFRVEVYRFAADEQFPRFRVEDALSEPDPHSPSRK